MPRSSVPQFLYLSKGAIVTTPIHFAELLWSVQGHLQRTGQMFITAPQMGFRTGPSGTVPLICTSHWQAWSCTN